MVSALPIAFARRPRSFMDWPAPPNSKRPPRILSSPRSASACCSTFGVKSPTLHCRLTRVVSLRSSMGRCSPLHLPDDFAGRRRRPAAAVLPLFLLIAGCGHKPTPSSTTGNVFRVPLDISLVSLDPALVSDTWSIGVMRNSFEGLVSMGEDNQIHPCLATSWKVSADGRAYTFSLRRDVVFHSGRPFRAEDVKKSFERACSKALGAPLASEFLNDIVGMKEFHGGQANDLA